MRLGRTVGELLHSISAKELAEWKVYHSYSPITDDRGDYQAGIIASTVANFAGKSLKGDKQFSPVDFMPYMEKQKPKENKAAAFRASLAHLVKRENG